MTDHHTTERLSADRHQDEVAVALFVRCDTAATESQTTRTIINQNLEGSSPSVHLASVSATRDILSDTGDEGPITLNLPTDRSRLPQQSFDNATLPVCFEGPLAISLRSLANEHKTGLDTVLLAAWSMVLSKLSGQDDIVIGVVKDKDNIGNLPLRIDLSGDPSGVQLFGRLKLAIESAEVERASLNHLHTPPQLQVTFQWKQASRTSTHGAAQTQSAPRTMQVDLEFHLQDTFNAIHGELRFVTTLFNVDTIKRHVGYIYTAVSSLITDPDRPISSIDILSSDEVTMLLETWNATADTFYDHLCIHQLFEHQVKLTPQATALVFANQELTYFELNTKANQLAHQLIKLGTEPDTPVAICVKRSPAMVVAVLAVLKAGGAYVPLDPSYPRERLTSILEDAMPRILMADTTGHIAIGVDCAHFIVLDPNDQLSSPKTDPQVPGLSSHHLAYIIYTSGSTGKPKGVMVEHQGVTNLVSSRPTYYEVIPCSRVLQFTSLSFDVSVSEIFMALCSGASLHLLDDHIRLDQRELWGYLAEHSITHVTTTPSLLQNCVGLTPLNTPVTFITGGEAMSSGLLKDLKTVAPRCSVFNEYGPTETTIAATAHRCTDDSSLDVSPIGRPLSNKRIYILNQHRQPVPIGVVGEMYIGGVGVARGYLNKPELTAQVFLDDPFHGGVHGRMYKSGDLARYLPDGRILFLGRIDDQVKIRGFRVEPGEIEARLSQHPDVRCATVIALSEGRDKRLVAYVAADHKDHLVDTLRSYLGSSLPDYMVPSAFVRLDSLPLSPNGKVDCKALPVPGPEVLISNAYEPPQDEIETTLVRIWSEILKIDRISRNDNFFALGGHSLQVAGMINRLHRCGLSTATSAVYGFPVLCELARVISKHREETIPANCITPQTSRLVPEMLPLISLSQTDVDQIIDQTPGGLANIQDIYALSPLQDGILFHHILASNGDPYLRSTQMAFESRDLLDRYLQAFQIVVQRHDILRTAFVWKELSTPAQVVWRQAPLHVHEIWLDPSNGSPLEQLNKRFHPGRFRIDLTQAPLSQLVVTQDSNGKWLLVQLMHHLIGDHAASEMMNHEIELILQGQERTLSAPQPFRNLVALVQKNAERESHEHFFKDMLADVEEPSFPFGLSKMDYDAAEIVESHQILPQSLSNRLRIQAKVTGVSLATLCHVGLAQVIARTSGEDRVVFGTVIAGRTSANEGDGQAMGFAINTLPFRCDVTNRSIRECVQNTQKRLSEIMEHDAAPLSLAQRCSGVPAGTPLFSVLLNFIHTSMPSQMDSEKEFVSEEEQVHHPGIELVGGQERTNYPFSMTVEDFGVAIGLTALIAQPVDPSRVNGYMRQALESLVEALECSPDKPALELDIMPPYERELLLQTWNSPYSQSPTTQTIHGLFEEQALRTPEATAVVFEGQEIAYTDLNERANRLAHRLIELGVNPDTLVAICVARSPAMVISALAVMKAGGAYLPLDPTYPSERLIRILEDAVPAILLADVAGHDSLSGLDAQSGGRRVDWGLTSVIELDPNGSLSTSKVDPVIPNLTSGHLAYVIYTSGSTGTPKGVLVEHHGVVDFMFTRQEVYGIHESSRVLQFSSFSFDGSVMDIFSALCFGGALHILSDHLRYSPQEIWNYLKDNSITQAFLPPALLQDFTDFQPLSNPLTMILAGESFPVTLLHELQSLLPNGTIVNEYGPTETSIVATSWTFQRDFRGDIPPVGRPIAGRRIYVLDKHRRPVPLGVTGEIYIGGSGVTRGYLNRPELTSQSFVHDPFVGVADARMYKTGDLGRYLEDGNICVLGRNDDQVKIRGFRIELGEIEARLCSHPSVRKAVVVAIGENQNKRLVAYVEAESNDQLAQTLRSFLASQLPDYMIPTAFVRMDALPLSHNSKVDRKALPEPGTETFMSHGYEPPRGEVETILAKIWGELLHLDQVSRNANFFALGGHSLLAVKVIERLRRCGLSLTIRALFKSPILSDLAGCVSGEEKRVAPPNLISHDTSTITPGLLPLIDLTQTDIDRIVETVPGGVPNVQDIYALTPLQEGILFHHMLSTKGDPYLVITCISFSSRELLDRFLGAVQNVVDRHDVLRTAFVWEKMSTPAQVVWRQASLSITELEFDSSEGSIKEQLMQRVNPTHHRIDLTRAPLIQYAISQDSDGQWLLVELLHHLMVDHLALEVMNTEIKAFLEGQGDKLSKPRPFRNLISQIRSGKTQADHERFFRDMLSDFSTPSLPFGLTEVHQQDDEIVESHRMLPQSLNDRLRSQAKRFGVNLASLCHLAWALVISRTSGEDRVVFGTVLFGRMGSGPGVDSAMGLFINALPLRIDLDGTVLETVLQTHERLASLLEYEYASLALAQRCSGIPSGIPLFNSLLNYRHNAQQQEETWDVPGIKFKESHERTNYPFNMSIEDFGTSLGVTALMTKSVDGVRVCGYLQQAMESLVQALEHFPETPLQHLEVLPVEEKELLTKTWNMTQKEYPDRQCVHHLFEHQVTLHQQAEALVFMDKTMTYSELNARANQIAHRLIVLGVKPDTPVVVCVERSLAMVISVLAVLKAGGAYVPLDPSYPKERLAYVLGDIMPNVVLADATGRDALRDAGKPTSQKDHVGLGLNVILDPNDSLLSPDTNPHVLDLTPRHLAYIIYTSGSTGNPKGVMIEHQGVTNLVASRTEVFGINPFSRVLQFFSFSFDGCAQDILATLGLGATLHILPDHIRYDPTQLWDYLEEHSITHSTLTPASLENCKNLRVLDTPLTLIFGGDILSEALIRRLQLLVPNGRIVNDYGPTETSVSAIAWQCPQDFCGDVAPIGRPIANKKIYILDQRRRIAPLGVAGELHIGGVGVARGYLNRPELTTERFVSDPFVAEAEARMYSTGDLARYDPDGNVIFLGRNDYQVKIRGFRIEPGEIEARLSDHHLVQTSVVVALGEGQSKRLVAYVVAEPEEQLVHTLRSHVASCLPDYMVPVAFVRLDQFPLLPSGKIDRRALPQPDDDSVVHLNYEAPEGYVQKVLCSLWVDLLKVERVGRHDNFFGLGGDSLLAVKLVSQIRGTMGFKIPLSTLFRAPTIAELAQHLINAGNSQEYAFETMLPIKSKGSRSPLFCIHPGMGMGWCFIGLLKHLDGEQPLYAVQQRGFFDNELPAESIQEMVSDYIDQIRQIQPHGPYSLLGFSFGGLVAHAMAVQLEEQGEEIALLVNMDASATMGQVALKTIEQYKDEIDMGQYFGTSSEVPELAKSFWEGGLKASHWNARLASDHSLGRYHGDMVLFRALKPQRGMDSPVSFHEWEQFVLGKIEVHDCVCTHDDMVDQERWAEIGCVLAQKLK